MRKKILLSLVLGLSFTLTGCGLYGGQTSNSAGNTPVQPQANVDNQEPSTNSAPASQTISVANFAFAPASLTINAGETITWQNSDAVAHTIVSPGLFSSPVLNQGGKFSYSFVTPGQFQYHCGIHPTMKGVIIVK